MKDYRLHPVGIDIGKSAYYVYWVDPTTGVAVNLEVKPEKILGQFVHRDPCLVGLEARSCAQQLARQLRNMGHEVMLVASSALKPFLSDHRGEVQSARAIWAAVQLPGIKAVPIDSDEDETASILDHVRQPLVTLREALVEAQRRLAFEYGERQPPGEDAAAIGLPGELPPARTRLPAATVAELEFQRAWLGKLGRQIGEIDRQLAALQDWKVSDLHLPVDRVRGPLLSRGEVAAIGDAKAYRSGPEFWSQLGEAPFQCKIDSSIQADGVAMPSSLGFRSILVGTKFSPLSHGQLPEPWVTELRRRRPLNTAALGLPIKMTRTAWNLVTRNQGAKRPP